MFFCVLCVKLFAGICYSLYMILLQGIDFAAFLLVF
jgi:hypothetical protein